MLNAYRLKFASEICTIERCKNINIYECYMYKDKSCTFIVDVMNFNLLMNLCHEKILIFFFDL